MIIRPFITLPHLIFISTNIYQYPISTWHVGDQPVNVLLAAEGGDALVQDHDGVELPGLGRPPHLGPVPHGARHHGVTHPGPEPWPPADTDIACFLSSLDTRT